jgi:hypothetical protein
MDRELQSVALAAKTGAAKRMTFKTAVTEPTSMLGVVVDQIVVKFQSLVPLEAGTSINVTCKVEGAEHAEDSH